MKYVTFFKRENLLYYLKNWISSSYLGNLRITFWLDSVSSEMQKILLIHCKKYIKNSESDRIEISCIEILRYKIIRMTRKICIKSWFLWAFLMYWSKIKSQWLFSSLFIISFKFLFPSSINSSTLYSYNLYLHRPYLLVV